MSLSNEKIFIDQQHDALIEQLAWASLHRSHPSVRFAQRILGRIVDVAEEFLKMEYSWEVLIVRDPTISAYSIPGLIIIPEGLLVFLWAITGSKSEVEGMLAAVIGHEVGHAIGRHAVELLHRRSRAVTGGQVAEVYLHNPASRELELEADLLGLHFLHAAGYDMQYALRLWEAMASCLEENSDQLQGFLGTHPPHRERLVKIEEHIPSVKEFWRKKRRIRQ